MGSENVFLVSLSLPESGGQLLRSAPALLEHQPCMVAGSEALSSWLILCAAGVGTFRKALLDKVPRGVPFCAFVVWSF